MTLIQRVLEETGLPPRQLEIEITESLLVKDFQPINAALHALADMGVRIAIDDFGNGYSSLRRLMEMPIDCLKIDHSFVSGIGNGSRYQPIIRGIIAMALGMGLTVIAEGVENARQLDFLRSHQCQLGQGFLFSGPLPESEALEFLQSAKAELWSGCH